MNEGMKALFVKCKVFRIQNVLKQPKMSLDATYLYFVFNHSRTLGGEQNIWYSATLN